MGCLMYWKRQEHEPKVSATKGQASNEVLEEDNQNWNPLAESKGLSTKTGHEDYGSTEGVPQGDEETKVAPGTGSLTCSLLQSGFISMALVFIVEVSERSPYAELPVAQKGISATMVLLVAYALASSIAVLLGYAVSSQGKAQLFFLAQFAYLALALACLSQAMMGIPSLAISHQAATALLSFRH